ncbi:MAG: TraB/GumN family protein [Candidatus Woesearchaeota archaeon]
MQKDIKRIFIDNREIILVGTAHVSKKSKELVKEVIEKEKPDSVGVELCKQRFAILKDKTSWQKMKIVKVIKEKKAFLLLSNLLLSSFQKKTADRMGIEPGAEMIEAINISKKEKIDVELLDRDVQITLKRAWSYLYFFDKLKLIIALFSSMFIKEEIDEKKIEEMKNKNIINEMMAELAKNFPKIKQILIDERDSYITTKILDSNAKKMVVVLGAGHMQGVIKQLNEKKKTNLDLIQKIKPKKPFLKIISYAIPVLFLSIIIYGFFTSGTEFTFNLLLMWFLINGTLSALGCLIVFAHPLTILSAFIAAPFTSLNPMIAAGWVAGLVEATIKGPRVKDLDNIKNDITTVKGFVSNRFTKILLVVVFANLGSSIGTFIALPYLLYLL